MYNHPSMVFNKGINNYSVVEKRLLNIHSRNTLIFKCYTILCYNSNINCLNNLFNNYNNGYYILLGNSKDVDIAYSTICENHSSDKILYAHLTNIDNGYIIPYTKIRIDSSMLHDIIELIKVNKNIRHIDLQINMYDRFDIEKIQDCRNLIAKSGVEMFAYLAWADCWKSMPSIAKDTSEIILNMKKTVKQLLNSNIPFHIGWYSNFSYCGAEHRNHRYLSAEDGMEYRCMDQYWNSQNNNSSPTNDEPMETNYHIPEIFPGSDTDSMDRLQRNSHIHRVTKELEDCSFCNNCTIASHCIGGCAPAYKGKTYNNIYCEKGNNDTIKI